MIDFITGFLQQTFGGMSLVNIACFIYIFRNFLSFILWCIKMFKKSIGV